MAATTNDSSVLFTGSVSASAGIEYVNLSGTGNSLVPTEDIMVSINRGPYAKVPAYQPFLVASTFTYNFQKDTVFLMGNYIIPDLYVTNESSSPADVGLNKNTETAAIVTTSDPKEITKGDLGMLAYLYNDNGNKDVDVVLRVYGSVQGLMHEAAPLNIPKNTLGINIVANIEITSANPIGADEDVWFTLEADEGDGNVTKVAVKGSNTPSQIRLVRKNL